MSQDLPLSLWQQWRARRAHDLVGVAWPLLQKLEEANKAWLLIEVGSLAGEIAAALARRSPWRDVLGVEESPGLLAQAHAEHHKAPEAHRLDWARCSLGRSPGTAPRLPLHSGYASGAVALGTLARLEDPAPLIAEIGRALRPQGSLLVGEPVGSFFRRVPREVQVSRERWSALVARIAGAGFAEVARAEALGVAFAAFKRPAAG